ncbi:MAG TPA: DUF2935 domain-containing protein [Patescibacteria group bacterium]|nr:DUF2935 domain-containing protein [Patescibacteria group bacterium]
MLSNSEFVRQSLELNLFFMRIAKEHSTFIEAAFTSRDTELAEEAEQFKKLFTRLLGKTIDLSEGLISPEVAESGELVTDLTLEAEKETEFYTGIRINNKVTQAELSFEEEKEAYIAPFLIQQVFGLNREAISAVNALAKYKNQILQDVLACKLFTNNYPLLLDHVLREARFYMGMLVKLQNRQAMNSATDIIEQEIFWNRIMAEHSKFIRGMLDPSEVQLFDTVNDFGKKFDDLTKQAETLTEQMGKLKAVTANSYEATKEIRDFKRQGTEGIVQCKIRSLAYPLLGDHVLREANHYLRILKTFKSNLQR